MTRLLLAAAFVGAAFVCPARVHADGVDVTLTMYTCDPHTANAMTNSPGMCVVTASGGSPDGWGLACPYGWEGTRWQVLGHVVTCDDTSAYSAATINGLPHIDFRLPTTEGSYERAYRWGLQTATIYPRPPYRWTRAHHWTREERAR